MITLEFSPTAQEQRVSSAYPEQEIAPGVFRAAPEQTLGSLAIINEMRLSYDEKSQAAYREPSTDELHLGYELEANPNAFLTGDRFALNALLNRDKPRVTRREIRQAEREQAEFERRKKPNRRLMRALGRVCTQLRR